LREDGDDSRALASYNQVAYGSSLLKERIVIKVVERINLQTEIQRLMQIPTYSQIPEEWKKNLHRMPLIEILQ
jgi:hypothetical protein